MARGLWISILTQHLVMMKSTICHCLERGCIQVVLRLYFCMHMVFVTIISNSERRTSRSTPLELYFPISHLPMTKRYLSFSLPILVLKNSSSLSARGMPLSKLARWLLKASLFSSGFDIVGTYTLIIVACSEVVSPSRFCHLLAVAFVSAL